MSSPWTEGGAAEQKAKEQNVNLLMRMLQELTEGGKVDHNEILHRLANFIGATMVYIGPPTRPLPGKVAAMVLFCVFGMTCDNLMDSHVFSLESEAAVKDLRKHLKKITSATP